MVARKFRLQGNAADFYAALEGQDGQEPAREILLESGAGTGKTFSWLIVADATAWKYPGCRQLFVRRTRVSMNTAPLPEWEKEILWPGHPALVTGAAHYKDRVFYRYPNGAEIWLAGFDSLEKSQEILSSKWDRFYIAQAEQVRVEDYENMISRLRGFNCALREGGRGNREDKGGMLLDEQGRPIDDGHRAVLDVNPAEPEHWIAKRFGLVRGTGRWEPPPSRRVFSYRHEDNPLLYDAVKEAYTPEGWAYVKDENSILEQLTGPRRERLLKHRWIRPEGAIWEDYDPEVHVIDGAVEWPGDGTRLLRVRGWDKPVVLRWFAGSLDWGFDDPCAFGCWGFDSENRGYMLREIYETGLTHDDLAERIGAIHKVFPMRKIVIDNNPAFQKTMNRWLSAFYAGREVGGICAPADKTRDDGEKSGIDIVRQRFRTRPDGTRGIYFLSTMLERVDPERRAKRLPCTVLEEIPSYVYRPRVDGKPWKEEPDPLCSKHGPDQVRYMFKWAWGVDLSVEIPVELKPVSKDAIDYAYELRHLEALAALERQPDPRGRWSR